MARICLVAIGIAPHGPVLSRLARRLERTFLTTVSVQTASFDEELAYDSNRGQVNSTQVLHLLLNTRPADCARIIGVTSSDLFVPVLTYVFGEAQLEGPAAVVSIARLRADAYGLKPDPSLLADRLHKEAVHELGHTWGLLHCRRPMCVMGTSTYAEEIDLKTALFCTPCLERIRSRPL